MSVSALGVIYVLLQCFYVHHLMIAGSSFWDDEVNCLTTQGTHLATLKSSNDVNDFKSACQEIGYRCWTGYNKYYHDDGEWFWLSDGTTKTPYDNSDDTFSQLTGLNTTEYDDQYDQSCVYYDSDIDEFGVGNCTASVDYNIICDNSTKYPDTWNARQWFVTLPMKMNWFDAQTFCASMYDSNAATITGGWKNDMAAKITNLNNSMDRDSLLTYWIGLHNFDVDRSSDDGLFSNYHWADLNRYTLEYRNFDLTESTFDQCVYFDATTNDGTWFTDKCENDNTHYLICVNPYKYAFGEQVHYSHRFRLPPTEKNSFDESRRTCLLYYGTHMATITNNSEHNFVENLANTNKFKSGVSIGYFDKGQVDNKFRWDNPHIENDYTNWYYNINTSISGEDDVAMVPSGSLYDGKWIAVNASWQGHTVCDSPYYDDGVFIEDEFSYVSIHTCEGYIDAMNSNLNLGDTLHMLIKDTGGRTSDYIIINKHVGLPDPGTWRTYEINDTSLQELNDENYNIFTISIGMATNELNYCIDGLIIYINGERRVLNDKFKNGIVLSTDCEHQFQYNQINDKLMYCNEGLFTLYIAYGSNIINQMFEVSLQTCSADGAGVDFTSLENGLKMNLIGKDSDSKVWVSTDTVSLNHMAISGNVDWTNVGTLIASNVEIFRMSIDQWTPISTSAEGTLIGLKIVVSEDDENWGRENFWEFDNWGLRVEKCTDDDFSWCPSTEELFELSEHHGFAAPPVRKVNSGVTDSTWIVTNTNLDSDFADIDYYLIPDADLRIGFDDTSDVELPVESIKVHIFAIFEEELDSYSLPYTFVDIDDYSWTEAENYCMHTYGTHLASVHSVDELAAWNLISQSPITWIGFTNRFSYDGEYVWSDNSGYINKNLSRETYWQFEPDSEWEVCGLGWNGNWVNYLCSAYPFGSVNGARFLCSTGVWNRNTKRTFNVPIASTFSSDDVVMVSIENNDDSDAICIESVTVNDITAQSIGNPWIGNSWTSNDCENNNCVETSYAVMKWPVCSIEIVNIRFDWGIADKHETERSITGLKCNNYNRLHSTTCEVNKEFTFETSTAFEFSEEQTYEMSSTTSNTNGKSTSTESSDTFGESFSETSATEFSIGKTRSKSATAGVEFEADYLTYSASVSIEGTLGVDKSKTKTSTNEDTSESSWERSTSTIDETYSEVTRENSVSSGSAASKTFGVSTTTTESVGCVASMDIPPSSSVSYLLTFAQVQAIIPTYTDLKLTMCSAYLESSQVGNDGDDSDTDDNTDDTDDDTTDDNGVIYIFDIVGQTAIDFASSCEVQFNPSTILFNEIPCYQEQQSAWLSESTYVPVCNKTDSTYYDGCQCNGLNLFGAATSCMCVDIYGNPSNEGQMLLHENADWRDTCRQLNCPNSVWTSTTTTPPINTGAALNAQSESDSNSNNNGYSIEIVIIIVLSTIFCNCLCCVSGVGLFAAVRYYCNKHNQNNNLVMKSFINDKNNSGDATSVPVNVTVDDNNEVMSKMSHLEIETDTKQMEQPPMQTKRSSDGIAPYQSIVIDS